MEDAVATHPRRDESAQAASARAAADHLTALLQSEPHRLRRRSISLGVPVDDADDAAQNVALRAWRSLTGLHSVEAGPLCAWLDSIASTEGRPRDPLAVIEHLFYSRAVTIDTASEHELTLWLVDEVPARMFYAGQRWIVTDVPTRLRDSVWSASIDHHPNGRGLYGWRFQATNAARESFVFDVYGGEGHWHVHRAYI